MQSKSFRLLPFASITSNFASWYQIAKRPTIYCNDWLRRFRGISFSHRIQRSKLRIGRLGQPAADLQNDEGGEESTDAECDDSG